MKIRNATLLVFLFRGLFFHQTPVCDKCLFSRQTNIQRYLWFPNPTNNCTNEYICLKIFEYSNICNVKIQKN